VHHGVGVHQLAGLVDQAVDVVAVEVAQDDVVDLFGLVTGGGHVGAQLAGGGRAVVGEAGVEQELGVAADHQVGGEGNVDVVGGQVLRGQQRLDLLQRSPTAHREAETAKAHRG